MSLPVNFFEAEALDQLFSLDGPIMSTDSYYEEAHVNSLPNMIKLSQIKNEHYSQYTNKLSLLEMNNTTTHTEVKTNIEQAVDYSVKDSVKLLNGSPSFTIDISEYQNINITTADSTLDNQYHGNVQLSKSSNDCSASSNVIINNEFEMESNQSKFSNKIEAMDNSRSIPNLNYTSNLSENSLLPYTTDKAFPRKREFSSQTIQETDLDFNLFYENSQPMNIDEPTLIPLPIYNLHKTITKSFSDFAFVYILSSQMCQEFMPMNCYVVVKLGLLLSLASIQKESEYIPIPIMVFGSDTSSANLIMSHIGNLAKRLITALDDFESGSLYQESMIEAGPMLLALGGVFYLGDWSTIKPKPARRILNQVDSGLIHIEKTPITYPVECAVWCYKTYKSDTTDLKAIQTFIEVFGIPLTMEKGSSDQLIDFLLEQASESTIHIPKDDLSISIEDMRQFLEIISKRRVDFNSDASQLLQKYFAACRADRPDYISKRSYICLMQMSESFAKLSMRYEVTNEDVLAAIYIFENFKNNTFGSVGALPSPTLNVINNYIGEVDVFFQQFESWLQDYLAQFSKT